MVVDTDQVPAERLPAAVELAAYVLVAEAVDDAAARSATRVTVRAARQEQVLCVVVEDDGREPAAELVRSEDRIGALGGTLVSEANLRRAEMPCA